MTLDDLRAESLIAGSRLPLLVRPESGRPELAAWAAPRRGRLERALVESGALLFRGFNVTASTFVDFMTAVSDELADYVYRSTPRTAVGARVYTATEYPARMTIPLHSENAYQRTWPRKLAFHCVVAAEHGGETSLADLVEVTARIGPDVRERFFRRGVAYVRNYGAGVDLPWQTVFQTDDPAAVEAFCRAEDIACEWLPGGRLRTRQVCQAEAVHPRTGQRLWFNQAHLFHVTNLDPATRDDLIFLLGEDNLPRNACFGDGAPILEADLAAVRAAFAAQAVAFPWQADDILLVDNMQVAHGRNPYRGPREVRVMMSDPWRPTLLPDGA